MNLPTTVLGVEVLVVLAFGVVVVAAVAVVVVLEVTVLVLLVVDVVLAVVVAVVVLALEVVVVVVLALEAVVLELLAVEVVLALVVAFVVVFTVVITAHGLHWLHLIQVQTSFHGSFLRPHQGGHVNLVVACVDFVIFKKVPKINTRNKDVHGHRPGTLFMIFFCVVLKYFYEILCTSLSYS